MPVRHDPRTGKFMGGAGGFKASNKSSVRYGQKTPLPGLKKTSVVELSELHQASRVLRARKEKQSVSAVAAIKSTSGFVFRKSWRKPSPGHFS